MGRSGGRRPERWAGFGNTVGVWGTVRGSGGVGVGGLLEAAGCAGLCSSREAHVGAGGRAGRPTARQVWPRPARSPSGLPPRGYVPLVEASLCQRSGAYTLSGRFLPPGAPCRLQLPFSCPRLLSSCTPVKCKTRNVQLIGLSPSQGDWWLPVREKTLPAPRSSEFSLQR